MDIAVWIIQGLLALAFFMAGLMKTSQPVSKIREKMAWANDVPPMKIKFIGFVEALGAIGLILPVATGIFPQLTWLAAAGLAIIMLLAAKLHFNRGEKKEAFTNLVLFTLLVFVAYSRFYCTLL